MIDVKKILDELETLPKYDKQIMLQTVEGNDDPDYGTGSIIKLKHSERDFKHPLFPQLEYTNSIIASLNMYRTRVLVLPPQCCYTYHRDLSKRIHIPLITNDRCLMIVDDIVYRYPADGNHYVMDTLKPHTALNGSKQDRIHIVGCI